MFESEFPSSYSIDWEKCHRTVPMRVLVLGLSRTGTESEDIYLALRKALVHLGYNGTYHGYAAAVEHPRDCKLWLRAMRAKYDGEGAPFVREDWDLLLGDYQLGVEAVCDVPAACFAEELMTAYPNAKVILTNRDVDAWFESVQKTLISNAFTRRASFISFFAKITRSPNRWTRPVMMSIETSGSHTTDQGEAPLEPRLATVIAALALPGRQSTVKVTSIGSAVAVSTFTGQAGVASVEIPNNLSTQEADEVTLTGTVGQVITTKPTKLTSTASTGGSSTSAATETVSNTSSSTTNGGHAHPIAIGIAISGIAGVLGVMIAM
ncbi:hypothetical protein PoHVEF18_006030 [Penicillium ochrochloron]